MQFKVLNWVIFLDDNYKEEFVGTPPEISEIATMGHLTYYLVNVESSMK